MTIFKVNTLFKEFVENTLKSYELRKTEIIKTVPWSAQALEVMKVRQPA